MAGFIRLRLWVGLAVLTCSGDFVCAQRVYSNSRPGASANRQPPRTATGGFSTGRSSNSTRWGIPGAASRNDWTLSKPTYSNSRSTLPRYNAGGNFGGSHTVVRPPRIHYSTPHHHQRSYGRYGGPIVYGAAPTPYYNYGNYGNLSPYDQARILNGLPLQYGNVYDSYPAIVAPPIVIPFGGAGLSLQQGAALNPVPNNFGSAPATKTLPPVPESVGQTFSKQLPADERPIIDEFFVAELRPDAGNVSTVDRIRSLRYQTSADSEFRRGDFAAAIVLYETSAETAPGRRAPWLRKAWAEIRLQQYDQAALSLKTALLLEDDPTSSWIPGEQLYGKTFNSQASLQNDELWKWLEQRPNSTDRLLLVAAFQQFQGYAGTARELIDASLQKGLDRRLVDSFREITQDQFDNANPSNAAGPGGNDRNLPPVDATGADARIQDKNVIGAGQQVEELGVPVPLESDVVEPRTLAPAESLQPEPNDSGEFSLQIPMDE